MPIVSAEQIEFCFMLKILFLLSPIIFVFSKLSYFLKDTKTSLTKNSYSYFIVENSETYLLVISAAMQPILIESGSEKLVPYARTLP